MSNLSPAPSLAENRAYHYAMKSTDYPTLRRTADRLRRAGHIGMADDIERRIMTVIEFLTPASKMKYLTEQRK